MIDRYAHASEAIVGARDYQEDFCLFSFADGGPVDERTGETGAGELVAVLADGMGGHVAGERASKTVCASFADAYASNRIAPPERLSTALSACNDSLASAIAQDQSLDGMGCTLVGVAFGERGMRWVSVGDSHLYLFRDRKLYLLNEDHSMAPVIDGMVSQGLLGNEEARKHPRRHMLRSALTGGDIELIEIGSKLLPLEAGLGGLPEVTVRDPEATRLRNGNPAPITATDLEYGDEAWASCNGTPVAIVVYKGGMLHPDRVFVGL